MHIFLDTLYQIGTTNTPIDTVYLFHGTKLNPTHYPDARLDIHCQLKVGQDTLYTPESTADNASKAVEAELEDAVARYAEDNLLVVRVRKVLPSTSDNDVLCQVFLKDPYYQKLTRARTTSGNSFFGSAGGSLFHTVPFHFHFLAPFLGELMS